MNDVTVVCHGSVSRIVPETQAATDWINENVQTEGWQWQGKSLVVESRFIIPVVEGMIEAGLDVTLPTA